MGLHGFLNTLLFTAAPGICTGATLWLRTRGPLGTPRGRRFVNLCCQQLHTLWPQYLRLLSASGNDPPEHLIEQPGYAPGEGKQERHHHRSLVHTEALISQFMFSLPRIYSLRALSR